MQTGAIRYRVADFLKKYPPFERIEEQELLQLVAKGRVKFHESDEYVYWQGSRHDAFVFVIQQGTVQLIDESDGREELRDIRGPGDMIGIERFAGAEVSAYAAKTTCDVVLYAIPAVELEALLARHPRAAQYVKAHALVHPGYEAQDASNAARSVLDTARLELLTCSPDDPVGKVARRMRARGASAISVVDAQQRLLGVITASHLIDWIAAAGFDSATTAEALMDRAVPCQSPDTGPAQCLLAHASGTGQGVAITADGSNASPLVALITARELDAAFGDQPADVLRLIRIASNRSELRLLNHRARRFVARQLTAPASVEWLAQFAAMVDHAVVARTIALCGGPRRNQCWFAFGSSGRGETLAPVVPQIALAWDGGDGSADAQLFREVVNALHDCGYCSRSEEQYFENDWPCASLDQWLARYSAWIRDPVMSRAYIFRSLFDVEFSHGDITMLERLTAHTLDEAALDDSFIRILAHDSLAHVPPLTFYRGLVVDDTGNQREIFHLKKNAISPIVDAARVLALAVGARGAHGTLARMRLAQQQLPEQGWLLAEAIGAFQVALLHQARAGIHEHTDGSELSPSGLSRYDQQLLKSGFRTIIRLLEFTAQHQSLEAP